MNRLIIKVFSVTFFFSVIVAIAFCVIRGLLFLQQGQFYAVAGWALLIGGPLLVLNAAGTIAIQIDNNRLLREIANRAQASTNLAQGNDQGEPTARRIEPTLTSRRPDRV